MLITRVSIRIISFYRNFHKLLREENQDRYMELTDETPGFG